MTLQSLAEPAVLTFCETCIRYAPPPAVQTRGIRDLGTCKLTGEYALEVGLCGDHRFEPERRKPSRAYPQPPRHELVTHMGHHMGAESTCANHAPGQPEPVCGISWADHQAHPTECLYPRPNYTGGRWLDPEVAAEAGRKGRARGQEPKIIDQETP